MPRPQRPPIRKESDQKMAEDEDEEYDDEEDDEDLDDGGEDGGRVWPLWRKCCDPCFRCASSCWGWCWGWGSWKGGRRDSTTTHKKDITYILQRPSLGDGGDSDPGGWVSDTGGGVDGERHGSFTSASLSMGSSQSAGAGERRESAKTGQRDLKELHYDMIEQHRRASGWTMRKDSAVTGSSPAAAPTPAPPLLDLRALDFWSGFTGSTRSSTSEPQPVQPPNQLLLSPGRRDTISSQGSADHIRPDLYEPVSSSGVGGDDEEEGVAVPCPSGPLGCLHFYLSYDINSKSLIVRIIEARDLPKPIQLDSSKTDQAHSNPYIKICLLPNQKDSRQTTLRKKTQNPRFDESFSFEIPFRELQRRTLQILVKDFDKYSRHRVVGQVLLPCEDINVVKGVHFWKQLEPVQAMSHDDLGEILFSMCYLPAAGRLNVDILRAKALVPTDLVGGAAPYVRVSVVINERHIKTKKTSYKKSTLDPVFNESLSFDVNSVQLGDCVVVVSVMDFNGGVVKDNFIGRVVLGKEFSGPHELNHWKNMMTSHRTAVAQWHSLKSRSHCDTSSTASRAIS